MIRYILTTFLEEYNELLLLLSYHYYYNSFSISVHSVLECRIFILDDIFYSIKIFSFIHSSIHLSIGIIKN